MKQLLIALLVAVAVAVTGADFARGDHTVRVRVSAPPSYYLAPPVVYQPAFVVPAPYVVHQPIYSTPAYITPVYRAPYYYPPRRMEYSYPVFPRGELKVKYKRRWYGYKVEYDYDD